MGVVGPDTKPVCAKPLGMCATSVAPITVAGIVQPDQGMFITSDDQTCNQVDATRLCDADAFYGDIDNPGTSECLTGRFFQNPNDGVCIAWCASPSVDRNDNGVIEADELGEQHSCPAGYQCTADFGRTFKVADAVIDPAGPFGIKSCDVTACTAGEPCTSECGPGDTECLTFEGFPGRPPFALCVAPFSTCVDAT